MKNNAIMIAGAFFIVATILYVSVISDASMCYQVPGCPLVRSVVFGY